MKTYETYDLTIKNMICTRCLKVIRQELETLDVEVLELALGKLKIKFSNKKTTFLQIKRVLEKDEFELVKNKDEKTSEAIKLALLEIVKTLSTNQKQNLSTFLTQKLHKDYWSLSKTFSKTEGITIERYFILLRIEKAKELIEYGELNFSEIAYELGYNNINHLSRQFKQVVHMSMTEYKLLKHKTRLPLDKII